MYKNTFALLGISAPRLTRELGPLRASMSFDLCVMRDRISGTISAHRRTVKRCSPKW